MLKISSLPLYRLRKSTHFELMNRFYGVLNDYETSHEKFLRAKAGLLDAIHKEEEKLMQFKSSTWTQVMAEHRDTMNDYFRSLVDTINAWSRNAKSRHYEDAVSLKRYIRRYKIVPTRMQMDTLMGTYRSLISDFTEPENLQKIRNIGAEDFLNEFILAHTAFSDALNERCKENSQKEGPLKDVRDETDAAFQEMVEAVNNLYYMTEDEVLGDMIKACNADIKRIKKHALHRRKRSETSTPAAATPSEQATEQPTPKPTVASPGHTTGITLPITTDVPQTQVNPLDDSSAPIIDIPFTQENNKRSETITLQTESKQQIESIGLKNSSSIYHIMQS